MAVTSFSYKMVFVWFVDGKRKKSSEVSGDLKEMKAYFLKAMAWVNNAPGRGVNVFSPGHFKTQAISHLITWIPKRERFENDMAHYCGD